jgi:hypothetical protein
VATLWPPLGASASDDVRRLRVPEDRPRGGHRPDDLDLEANRVDGAVEVGLQVLEATQKRVPEVGLALFELGDERVDRRRVAPIGKRRRGDDERDAQSRRPSVQIP